MDITNRIDEFLGMFSYKKQKIEWYAEYISNFEEAFNKGYLSFKNKFSDELKKGLNKVNPSGKLSTYDAVMKLSVDEADKLWRKLEKIHAKATDDWE